MHPLSLLSLLVLAALATSRNPHSSAAGFNQKYAPEFMALLDEVRASGHERVARSPGRAAFPYPRVGKKSFATLKRGDFLNFLADSWQQTGSLRNALREVQDMTESKRSDPAMNKRIPIARLG